MALSSDNNTSWGRTLRGYWVAAGFFGAYCVVYGVVSCVSSDPQTWWNACVKLLIPSFIKLLFLLMACVLLHRGAEPDVPRWLGWAALLLGVLNALCSVGGVAFWSWGEPLLCRASNIARIPLGAGTVLLCLLARRKSVTPPYWEERAEELLRREEDRPGPED